MPATPLTMVKFTVIDSNGDPLSGGKVHLFETGTATRKTSWTDASKGTPNANPVILDSNGAANIWIDSTDGQYRVRVDDANDVNVVPATDNIDNFVQANVGGDTIFLTEHQSDGSHGGAFIWDKGADVASATALTLGTDGNYFDITGTTTITSIGTLGIGTVVKLHFDGVLTLTHNATDLVLPGGVDIITRAGDEFEFIEYATGDWRLIGGNNRSVNGVVKWLKGADVASATALPLISDGNYFDVTGTTTVTSMDSLGIGTTVKLHFDGILTLTHHSTNLVLPGGVSIITVAGDELEFTEYASGDWRMTGGNAANLAVTSLVVSSAAASPPVANTLYKGNIVKGWINFDGTGTVAINGSFNVDSLTDNGTGTYTVNWDTNFADANFAVVASSDNKHVDAVDSFAAGASQIRGFDNAHNLVDTAHMLAIAIGDQ